MLQPGEQRLVAEARLAVPDAHPGRSPALGVIRPGRQPQDAPRMGRARRPVAAAALPSGQDQLENGAIDPLRQAERLGDQLVFRGGGMPSRAQPACRRARWRSIGRVARRRRRSSRTVRHRIAGPGRRSGSRPRVRRRPARQANLEPGRASAKPQPEKCLNTRLPFVPPNPNEFDTAARIGISRAVCGT